MIAQAGSERFYWYGEFARIYAQARKRAACTKNAERILKGRLCSERLDSDIYAFTTC
jgi:hypothetical protein